MKYIILFIFLFSTNVCQSKDWSNVKCPKNIESVASEAVEWLLMGPTLTKGSHCLATVDFKYIEAAHIPPEEHENNKPDVIIDGAYTFKITDTKENEFGTWDISFDLSYEDEKLSETIELMIYTPMKNTVRDTPCASVLRFPKRTYIRKECL